MYACISFPSLLPFYLTSAPVAGVQPRDGEPDTHPLHRFRSRLVALLLPLLLHLIIGSGSEEILCGFGHCEEGHAIAVVTYPDADFFFPREDLLEGEGEGKGKDREGGERWRCLSKSTIGRRRRRKTGGKKKNEERKKEGETRKEKWRMVRG